MTQSSIDLPIDTDHFTRKWINLAQPQLGTEVVFASDEFYGAKELLIKTETPIFLPDEYDDHGKWMDGWETRRKRHDGHDHCIIKLGYPGMIRGVDIDTSHFTGNYPPSASIDACFCEEPPQNDAAWTRILQSQTLQPDSHNLFTIDSEYPWNYLRLNIYPDGGIARLRVYGEIAPDWENFDPSTLIDLLALENGGRALMCNDEHFGCMHNIIKSHPPLNMGDGWETRRRRTPGYDWAIYSLGRVGVVEQVSLETLFFKGNYPDHCSIQGALLMGGSEDTIATQSLFWQELLPQSKLSPDNKHHYKSELNDIGPISHVRLNIFPDGGISRLRLFGKVAG